MRRVLSAILRGVANWLDMQVLSHRVNPSRHWCEGCRDNIRPGEDHYSTCPKAERVKNADKAVCPQCGFDGPFEFHDPVPFQPEDRVFSNLADADGVTVPGVNAPSIRTHAYAHDCETGDCHDASGEPTCGGMWGRRL